MLSDPRQHPRHFGVGRCLGFRFGGLIAHAGCSTIAHPIDVHLLA
ncbi:MAG: hypothetical protein ACQESE_02445 [Nanobdellota archaeon]